MQSDVEGQQPGIGRFGKFILRKRLGAGGMAEVFLAEMVGPEGFGKLVALKRILPHLTDDTSFTDSFISEARLGGSLNHPNIVQTLELGREGEHYYLAMEYVQGMTLAQLIRQRRKRGNPLPLSVVLDIARQICDALAYAHSATDPRGNPLRMIHRDLKPDNILLSKFGVVKITDFGVAKATSNLHKTVNQVVKGTIGYMSPEQATGETLDHRSDLYSFGAIFFEMLTLEPLYPDAVGFPGLFRVQKGDVSARLELLEALPDRLVDLLARLFAVNRDERPASALEIKRELTAVSATVPTSLLEVTDIVREALEEQETSRVAESFAEPLAPARAGTSLPPYQTLAQPTDTPGALLETPPDGLAMDTSSDAVPSSSPPSLVGPAHRPEATTPAPIVVESLWHGHDTPDGDTPVPGNGGKEETTAGDQAPPQVVATSKTQPLTPAPGTGVAPGARDTGEHPPPALSGRTTPGEGTRVLPWRRQAPSSPGRELPDEMGEAIQSPQEETAPPPATRAPVAERKGISRRTLAILTTLALLVVAGAAMLATRWTPPVYTAATNVMPASNSTAAVRGQHSGAGLPPGPDKALGTTPAGAMPGKGASPRPSPQAAMDTGPESSQGRRETSPTPRTATVASVPKTVSTGDSSHPPGNAKKPPAPRAPLQGSGTTGHAPHQAQQTRTRDASRHGTSRTAGETSAAAPSRAHGYLTVNARPWAYVFVDGKKLPATTPLAGVSLPAGRHRLVFKTADGRTEGPINVIIRPNEHKVLDPIIFE